MLISLSHTARKLLHPGSCVDQSAIMFHRLVQAAGASHASSKLSLVLDAELLSSWQTQAATVQTESK